MFTDDLPNTLEPPKEVSHHKGKSVTLVEDVFGYLQSKKSPPDPIRRFTWSSNNRVQVQVITFGARILSLRLPDRKGNARDVVLGYDNLAQMKGHDGHRFCATIGRTCNKAKNATFVLCEGEQFTATKNCGEDHVDGGDNGFDKVNWVPYVDGKKVIMSHLSTDTSEGYPGHLLVQITFELSAKSEFRVDIVAHTTRTTVVDIANRMSFNLAGHETGAEELGRHVVMLNANCHTPYNDEGLPNGLIVNVTNTRYDFQTPKLMKKAMGLNPYGAYNQNFCVNRGCDQDLAFVARVTHPCSGRILEVYSNQMGVNFDTLNDLGSSSATTVPTMDTTRKQGLAVFLKKLHAYLSRVLHLGDEEIKAVIENVTTMLQQKTTSKTSMESYADILDAVQSQIFAVIDACLPQINEGMDFEDIRAMVQEHMLKLIGSNESGLGMDARLMRDLPGKRTGKNGVVYERQGGMCLQTQNYPNASQYPHFPSPVLKPNDTYRHSIVYKFWIQGGNPYVWLKRIEKESDPCTKR